MKIREASMRIAIVETTIRLSWTDKVLVMNLGSRNIMVAKIVKKKENAMKLKLKRC